MVKAVALLLTSTGMLSMETDMGLSLTSWTFEATIIEESAMAKETMHTHNSLSNLFDPSATYLQNTYS